MSSDAPSEAVNVIDLTYEVEAKALLERVNLQAARGQILGLIGPNGAGKTTLLRAVAGILATESGAIQLEGRELASLTQKEIAYALSIVPQSPAPVHGFTAKEVVMMGRYPHLGRFQVEGRDDQRIALESMRLTETDHFADRTLDTLSGGERQRVLVSRALAQKPRVLLLDEPTSNLDVFHQLKVFELVRRLADDGLTAIAAIHDLGMAVRYCDRLVLLREGKVISEGRPEEVISPEAIENAFGVRAAIYSDPITGLPAISLMGPVEENGHRSNSDRDTWPTMET